MKIGEIVDFLENWAHPSLQESYDNSGLIIGDRSESCQAALISLDVTEDVLDEAIENQCNLILAHHPLIFNGVKRIGKNHWIDKCIRKAIKHDISIYAIHTNLDNVHTGVNKKICDKLSLTEVEVLQPKSGTLVKLTVFVPESDKDQLLNAIFAAGAGQIGDYDECSFSFTGEGTFRGNEASNPSIGKRGIRESVAETRVEVMIQKHLLPEVIKQLKKVHPYEEVAYYTSELLNVNQEVGSGMIGILETEMKTNDFLNYVKEKLGLQIIKHTNPVKEKINRVAVCGGSGSFLLRKAIRRQADVFISSDFKYHDFFEANNQIIIADIGHYESEVYTKDLLYDELTKTFANFAFRLSKVDTNPIKYL